MNHQLNKVVNIFLGVSIDRVNLGNLGWGLVLGWILSVLAMCIIMEFLWFFWIRNGLKNSYLLVYFNYVEILILYHLETNEKAQKSVSNRVDLK